MLDRAEYERSAVPKNRLSMPGFTSAARMNASRTFTSLNGALPEFNSMRLEAPGRGALSSFSCVVFFAADDRVRLGVVDHVDLAGLQCGISRRGVGDEPPHDRVEIGGAGVAGILGRGGVVLIAREGDRILFLPLRHDERTGADRGGAVLFLGALQRLGRLDGDPGLAERVEQRRVRGCSG